jgi:hypothetical protein
MASAALHPLASHSLPSFITAPGETDVLMVVMGLFLAVAVLIFGILFFRLHSLPERIAHTSHKIQFEIVAVLCLISLFTHMHIFWIAAVLLALIDVPDFSTPLRRIAGSVERIAGGPPIESAAEADEPVERLAAGQAKPDGPAPATAERRAPERANPVGPEPVPSEPRPPSIQEARGAAR